MASVFGHGIVAYTIAKVSSKEIPTSLLFLAIGSSILPDLDVIAFNFGIPYEHMFGHRGITHSVLFALVWAILLAYIFGKTHKNKFFVILFLSTLSHGILDAMTSGGRGVGFLIPFSSERFFFSFRGIKVSPIGIEKFFSEWGLKVILSELKYILVPCLLILITLWLIKKFNNGH